MDIPKQYKGREQTYFKHCLLEAYLERLFMIVGQYASTICYVDCFAGPWEEQGDDLGDTSIAKSLNIIKKCRDGLSVPASVLNSGRCLSNRKANLSRSLKATWPTGVAMASKSVHSTDHSMNSSLRFSTGAAPVTSFSFLSTRKDGRNLSRSRPWLRSSSGPIPNS